MIKSLDVYKQCIVNMCKEMDPEPAIYWMLESGFDFRDIADFGFSQEEILSAVRYINCEVKQINYFWYDHMLRDKMPTLVEAIDKAIKDKDYNSFLFYYNNENNGKLYELPPITEEKFYNLTYSEYECG